MLRKSMRIEWMEAQKKLKNNGFTPEEIAIAKAEFIEVRQRLDEAYERYQALQVQVEKERIVVILEKIAVNKIKRSKIFNLGLGLKLSMRDCGMY